MTSVTRLVLRHVGLRDDDHGLVLGVGRGRGVHRGEGRGHLAPAPASGQRPGRGHRQYTGAGPHLNIVNIFVKYF